MTTPRIWRERHPVLGWLRLVETGGWLSIYHERTGKLLNYHPAQPQEPQP
jgi:hypothetical protein